MKNKIIIPTILFGVILVFSFYALSQNKNHQAVSDSPVANESIAENNQTENKIIFFYGDGCPHCAIVEEYIEENRVNDKIAFSTKEVYYNRSNSKQLEEKAEICGMPTDSIGVPFLWDGEKCLVGDVDIIEFFKSKINI